MHGPMMAQLCAEANALAQLPTHRGHPHWTINADAGTVREVTTGDLVVYLHPLTQAPIPGFWFFPHDPGST